MNQKKIPLIIKSKKNNKIIKWYIQILILWKSDKNKTFLYGVSLPIEGWQATPASKYLIQMKLVY